MKKKDKATERAERLMPGGIPRYIRVYDHPEYADRYTVVFTGRYKGRERSGCDYLVMSSMPFNPMGICQHEESNRIIDYPSYKHLGKRIRFEELPEDCQKQVLADYRGNWGLS